MATPVDSLVAKAGILLNDVAAVRWTAAELIGWLNDGQRQIVELKPEANATRAAVQLTAGTTVQVLPIDGIALVGVTRNMGADGNTPGDAIRRTDTETLDAFRSAWHSEANAGGSIQNFAFDFMEPKRYLVYPKAPATPWYVEVVYGAVPAAVASGQNIVLGDEYANALVSYMLFKAYAKDAEDAANLALSTGAYNAFISAINAKTTVEAQRDPNQRAA